MTRKKAGVLIGSVLGFLSQVKAVFAQDFWEYSGEYLNPIAKRLVGDNFAIGDPNMLWFYVLLYIWGVSILLFAGLKKNKLFANQHGLAKNLSIILAIMIAVGGSTSAIGSFGLAQGMAPILVMFLVVGLLMKLMPKGAGGIRSSGGALSVGSSWGAAPSSGQPGLFRRAFGSIWGGYKDIRKAQKLEKEASSNLVFDAKVDGYIRNANAIEMEISNEVDAIEKGAYSMEEYKAKLEEWESKYLEDMAYIEDELYNLKYGVSQENIDPLHAQHKKGQLESALNSVQQKQAQLVNSFRAAIRKQEGLLEQQKQDEEREVQTADAELQAEIKSLREELQALREAAAAAKASGGDEKQANEKVEKAEKELAVITHEEEGIAKEKKEVAEKTKREIEEEEENLKTQWTALDKLQQVVGEVLNSRLTKEQRESARKELNIQLGRIWPTGKYALKRHEHIDKLDDELKQLEGKDVRIEAYRKQIREYIRKLQGQQSKEEEKVVTLSQGMAA
jgi:hypothetical protein